MKNRNHLNRLSIKLWPYLTEKGRIEIQQRKPSFEPLNPINCRCMSSEKQDCKIDKKILFYREFNLN